MQWISCSLLHDHPPDFTGLDPLQRKRGMYNGSTPLRDAKYIGHLPHIASPGPVLCQGMVGAVSLQRKPRPESLRRGFSMPASSNVCRQRQQDNRVACAAPGKLDPRFPFSSRPSRAFLILRIPYQAHRWMQLRDLSPSSRARPHCGFPGSSSLVPLRRGLGSM